MGREGSKEGRSALWLYVLGAVLILVGIGTALYNTWPDIAFQSGLVAESYPYPTNFSSGSAKPASSRPALLHKSTKQSTKRPEGRRIVIPRIGVNVAIFEGSPYRALALGVYHHTETASPGHDANTAIAGHRNRRRFALLYRLVPGDQVIVYWDGKEYDYLVDKVFGRTPQQNEFLRRGSAEKLTLYTCKPRFLGNLRTVVTAHRVNP